MFWKLLYFFSSVFILVNVFGVSSYNLQYGRSHDQWKSFVQERMIYKIDEEIRQFMSHLGRRGLRLWQCSMISSMFGSFRAVEELHLAAFDFNSQNVYDNSLRPFHNKKKEEYLKLGHPQLFKFSSLTFLQLPYGVKIIHRSAHLSNSLQLHQVHSFYLPLRPFHCTPASNDKP